MELWELVARENIRDIVVRYNACGDSGRIDEMMGLFSQNAVFEVAGSEALVGTEAIRDFFLTVAESRPGVPVLRSLRHHTATHQIDIRDSQSARARCYFAVYTQDGLDHWGRYVDEFVYIEGRWLFSRRAVVVEGVAPGGWAQARGMGE